MLGHRFCEFSDKWFLQIWFHQGIHFLFYSFIITGPFPVLLQKTEWISHGIQVRAVHWNVYAPYAQASKCTRGLIMKLLWARAKKLNHTFDEIWAVALSCSSGSGRQCLCSSRILNVRCNVLMNCPLFTMSSQTCHFSDPPYLVAKWSILEFTSLNLEEIIGILSRDIGPHIAFFLLF